MPGLSPTRNRQPVSNWLSNSLPRSVKPTGRRPFEVPLPTPRVDRFSPASGITPRKRRRVRQRVSFWSPNGSRQTGSYLIMTVCLKQSSALESMPLAVKTLPRMQDSIVASSW